MVLSKKRLLALIAVLAFGVVFALGFTACGGGGEGDDAEEEGGNDKTYTFKWAHSSPADNDRLADASVQIIEELKEESGGRLVFEHYPASQLGAEAEILEGVQAGSIDVGVISTGPMASLYKPIAATAVPYAIADRDVAWKVYDGEFGQKLATDMGEATGMKIFGWCENGFRTFSNSKKEITSPADMKGLKIRTMENPIHMEMVDLLGASAVPVTFAELYTALSQGTVDGQENGLVLTYTNKLYEQLKYITQDNHIYDPYGVFMSQSAYDSLPDDLKELLDTKMAEFIQLERDLNAEYEGKSLTAMEEAGLKVTDLSEAQLQKFKDATEPVITSIRKDAGDELVDLFLSEIEAAK